MKLLVLCVFLVATTSSALAQQRPPGMQFVSGGALQWEVLVDQYPACVTPCALDVPYGRWVTMRSVEPRPVRVDVGMLDGPASVTAHPMARGAYVTGIVFTSLGGMALATGITLTAIGCSSDDRRGMCLAGLITGGVGAVVTTGSILLMVNSVPKVRIHRHANLYIGPTGAAVAGTF